MTITMVFPDWPAWVYVVVLVVVLIASALLQGFGAEMYRSLRNRQ